MKFSRRIIALFLCLAFVLPIGVTAGFAADSGYQTIIVDLKTNDRVSPMEVDSNPTFSWAMDSNLIGQEQTAYQITVKNCDQNDKIVWDSGKVESDQSYGVSYQGESLKPGNTYCWQVAVYDINNQCTVSDIATFQTGLMSDSIDAWNDGEGNTAQWIGASELAVKAKDVLAYNLNYDLQLSPQSIYAGVVFGANDPRLSDPTMNAFNISGENYFAVVADISQTPAQMKIIRVGYLPVDYENGGTTTVASVDIPETILNEETKYENHSITLNVTSSGTSDLVGAIQMDGANLISNVKLMDGNPLGTYFSASPRLNEIGFLAAAGTAAKFQNFSVTQDQHGVHSVLFAQDTGATYQIFESLDGVSVQDGTINVTGGKEELVAYVDPSYSGIPMVRKSANIEKTLQKAKLYITARGVYEFFINGQRVGEDWFNPGYTQYNDFITYSSYDVTDYIRQGENALGAWMSSGWWSDSQSFFASHYNYWGEQPSLLAKLDITYTDGSQETILTDETWKYSGDGPIVYSGMLDGEDYDATKEADVTGWNDVGFNDNTWKPVDVDIPISTNASTDAKITAKLDDPVRQVELIDATKISNYPYEDQNVYAYDMGTNMVGVPQIKLPEMPAGRVITIRYGEYLYPELEQESQYDWENHTGVMVSENLFYAMATDTYITKGTPGGEIIQPHFTFHGYQYLEIHGLDEPLPAENVKGISLSSIMEQDTFYNSSNPLTNQLFENIMRSAYGNHVSIPTDCPQRAERMGWTGDAMVFSRTATYLGQINNFYRSWAQSLRSVQSETNGSYPQTVPATGYFAQVIDSNAVCWPGASLMICWESFRQYGDTSFIKEHFDSMKRFLDGLSDNLMLGKQYLTSGTGLADHLALVTTDASLCSNVYYAYYVYAFSEMAKAIGENEIALAYADLYQNIKTEWNQTFIDPQTGKTIAADGTVQDTQTSYALPIAYGIIADDKLEQTGKLLVAACKKGYQDEEFTITTGFVGTAPLLPALTLSGNNDVAYTMFTQTNYPSWLYPVTQGATSMWERWDIIAPSVGFNGGVTNASSFNHYAYGAIGEWMINYHMGIMDDKKGGYQQFILQPISGGDFTYVDGSFDSNYGTIVSNWTASENQLTSYKAVIPANTTATLYLPVNEEALSGFTATAGMEYLGMEEHNGQMTAKFSLEAGGYNFAVQDGKLTASIADGYVTDETEPADKGILNFVIAYAENAKASGEYDNAIASVQASFDKALETSKAVAANDAATKEEVDNAWAVLLNEIHKLGFVAGDKDALSILIQTGDEITERLDEYVDAGKEEFSKALEAAKGVYDDGDAMQAEINEVADDLLNAMLNLRFKADKSVLEDVLAEANKIDANAYTAESYAVLQAAVAEANDVMADENASQEEVDTAVANVQAAMDQLVAVDGNVPEETTPSTNDTATQTGQESTTTKANAAKTGDFTPIVGLTAVSLAGIVLLFTRKKK